MPHLSQAGLFPLSSIVSFGRQEKGFSNVMTFAKIYQIHKGASVVFELRSEASVLFALDQDCVCFMISFGITSQTSRSIF